MKKMSRQLGAALLALGLSQAAMAVTVWDNGPPNAISGTNMSEPVVAENFTLGLPYNVSNLRFWSIQQTAADYRGSVSWTIYNNSANQPGSVVFSGLTNAVATPTGGTTGFGYGVYVFNVPVAFTLNPGNYWLGLHNGPLSNINSAEMLWATTTTQIGSFGLYSDGSTWVNSLNEHAFLIEGTVVPEPATTALLLAGLAGTLAAARRRKSA